MHCVSPPTPKIHKGLYFGHMDVCSLHDTETDIALVHACKEPCHRKAAGYSVRSLPSDHPHYLSVEKDNHLYLNLIDPPVPLFQLKSFHIALEFAMRQLPVRPLYIHCNQGQSRAPSLAMLIMAKLLGELPDESYVAARTAFEAEFPYSPGKGIETFLTENWDKISVPPPVHAHRHGIPQ